MYTIWRAIFGLSVVDADVFATAIKDLKDDLRVINTHLQGKSFLVGDR